MPGIVGIIGRGPPDEYLDLIRTMIGTMMHRPDYVSGVHFDSDLGIYVGWVAHEGSYASRQSESTGDSEISLALSGECFPGASDRGVVGAEVDVVAKYAARGEGFVSELNGLFSGVLIDRRRKSALVFNDRYAAERLYFSKHVNAVCFASEAKALLATIPATRHLDEQGVAQYLAYGSICDGRSLFRDIRLVPGGSVWFMERDRPLVKKLYFQPRGGKN